MRPRPPHRQGLTVEGEIRGGRGFETMPGRAGFAVRRAAKPHIASAHPATDRRDVVVRDPVLRARSCTARA